MNKKAYKKGFETKCNERGVDPALFKQSSDAYRQLMNALMSGSKHINRELLGLNDVKGFGTAMTRKSKVDWPKGTDPINDLPMSPGVKRIGVSSHE